MLLTKVKGVAAVVLALAAVGAGGGALSYRAAAGPAQAGPTARLAARSDDPDAQQTEALKRENAALKERLAEMQRRLEEDQAKTKAALANAEQRALALDKELKDAKKTYDAQMAAQARKATEDRAADRKMIESLRADIVKLATEREKDKNTIVLAQQSKAKAERSQPKAPEANQAKSDRAAESNRLRELAERYRVDAQKMQQEVKARQAATEDALAKAQVVAEQSRAEALRARKQYEVAQAQLADYKAKAKVPVTERGAAARKARDEVELLKAQLDVKKAELMGARAGLDGTLMKARRLQALLASKTIDAGIVQEAETEVAKAKAQVLVKEAELKAAEVALQQAMRRQREAEGGPRAAAAPDGREQRLKELEVKLDALRKEIQSLRRGAGPNKP